MLLLIFTLQFELSIFPGPVIVTSNCIKEPRKAYADHIYTINEVGANNYKVYHIKSNEDCIRVIDQSLTMDGFANTVKSEKYVTTRYNQRAVLPLANKIIEAFKPGDILNISLIGGCDGSEKYHRY